MVAGEGETSDCTLRCSFFASPPIWDADPFFPVRNPLSSEFVLEWIAGPAANCAELVPGLAAVAAVTTLLCSDAV